MNPIAPKHPEDQKLTAGTQQAIHRVELNCVDALPPMMRLEHNMCCFVCCLVIPLFSWANAGVVISGVTRANITRTIATGIVAGRFAVKTANLLLFSAIKNRLGRGRLPEDTPCVHLLAAGLLTAIGFAMSDFINGLGFDDPKWAGQPKMGSIIASMFTGIAIDVRYQVDLVNNSKIKQL